jgi:hypothetical protein
MLSAAGTASFRLLAHYGGHRARKTVAILVVVQHEGVASRHGEYADLITADKFVMTDCKGLQQLNHRGEDSTLHLFPVSGFDSLRSVFYPAGQWVALAPINSCAAFCIALTCVDPAWPHRLASPRLVSPVSD